MAGDKGCQNDGVCGQHSSPSRGSILLLTHVNGRYRLTLRSAIHTDDTVNISLELCDMVALQVPEDEDSVQMTRQEPGFAKA